MKSGSAFLLGSFLLSLTLPQALAAVPLANPEQDRRAKQAVPPSGKALIYVYRLGDAGADTAPGLWLNGRDSGRLEPRTYGMWAAGPGRLDIRAGKAGAAPLTFTCQAGRVYFVQLSVNKDGSVSLKQVSYGAGRTELQQARLVLDPALAARATAAPKPSAPVSVPARKAPAAKKAPPVEKPKARPEPDEDEKGESGVTLIAKVGSFQLASASQTIVGLSREFSAASVAYGLEGEWRFQNGFALGVELFGHTQDYTTTGSAESGDMAVTNVFINAKKYFRPAAVVQPYVGIGLGSAAVSLSAGSNGGVTGSTAGFAVQGMAGIAFRWRHVGIYTEVKYERAELEATNAGTGAAETIDASGAGLFAGMSVHF